VTRSRFSLWEWTLLVGLVLAAWGLRVYRPAEVPPGWRDDELIHIHTLTGQVLAGRPVFYFTGASGHEPLYHTLNAAIIPLLGMNPLGAHFLTIASGVLTVPLTYALCRRLFGRPAARLAAALLASGFWSLMYSRFALRQQMLVPLAVAVFYLLWLVAGRASRIARHASLVACGSLLAAALYTYTVARMLPFVLLGFGLYLALFHRERFRRWWWPLLATLLLAAALTVPLWAAIVRGRSEAAQQGVGADARIAELAVPLRELQAGDPRTLLENVWATLGMFHAGGDSEWLYNLPGRPVFGPLGAALFFIGLGLCLWRWRRPEYAFLLIWLAVGLVPALVTLPPASLSHTILAQPVVCVLPALTLAEGLSLITRPLSSVDTRFPVVVALLLPVLCVPLVARDLRDYFVIWPEQWQVRFLNRAEYREAARWLDGQPQVVDVAVASGLMGPWDRVALADDLRRGDVRVRLFDPRRALLLPAGDAAVVLLTAPLQPDPALVSLLGDGPAWEQGDLRLYRPQVDLLPADGSLALFADGLELLWVDWPDGGPAPGREATAWLTWRVARQLDLPPIPLVPNPPPPGVYSGPRLAAFAHLVAADGSFPAGDDGLWVDPTTLQPGDRFVQLHRFSLPDDAPTSPYRLEVGLYDPLTGDRWTVLGRDGQRVGDMYAVEVSE